VKYEVAPAIVLRAIRQTLAKGVIVCYGGDSDIPGSVLRLVP